MSIQKVIPPRLHILSAREAKTALILRKGPSKQVAVIGWNREDDSFAVGQWLKGTIYPYRCDISPDGKHWLYFAMKKGEPYTALARTPYLKAMDFYGNMGTWDGGGLFLDHERYWLNADPAYCEDVRRESVFQVIPALPGGGENHRTDERGVYFSRLMRDGWHMAGDKGWGPFETAVFIKQVNGSWNLEKRFCVTNGRQAGKGSYHEEYALISRKTLATVPFPEWEWADVDDGRIVWAEAGRIMAGLPRPSGLEEVKLLYDTNPLAFEELAAPY